MTTKTEEKKRDSPSITCFVNDTLCFFNCTQDMIDKAVDNENRRRAYFRIDELEDIL